MVNFSGLLIPLLDPDASIYATISKTMVLQNNYIELIHEEKDWLDKPHLPFWITAVFFKLFGIHGWSYKLPGILFVLLGAYYTYLFSKQYYNKTVALLSVFILLTAQHIILSSNDVRAEPFLTGLIIAAIYHFSNTLNKRNRWHLVAASFYAACAVMTKGPFTLIPVCSAIAGELIIKRNWKTLFHWQWLIAGILILLFITPELYSLWYQFDNHPEKKVFGKTGVSGIRFFLWDSQFGRFFNTGPIKGKGDPFFFIHTLIWAFLPWSLIMFTALYNKIRSGIKKINIPGQEWFTLTGSLFTLFVFSLSGFQLPYYSNIIFPLLAILTAHYIVQIQRTMPGVLRILQNSISFLLVAAGILLQIFYTPAIRNPVLLLIIAGVIAVMTAIPFLTKATIGLNTLYRSGLAVIVLNLYLNWFFFPDLLKYQASSEAAFYMNKNRPGEQAVSINSYDAAFEFYLKTKLVRTDKNISIPAPVMSGIWYASANELALLKKNGAGYEIIKELPQYHVTQLSFKFINKKTRDAELNKYYLVKLIP
jgi:4-amino-4-deoxy-L-arabinose transferase-like glycosyltransferase